MSWEWSGNSVEYSRSNGSRRYFFPVFLKTMISEQVVFPWVCVVPGRFKQIREALKEHFQSISCHMDFVMQSYAEKKLTTKKQRLLQCERMGPYRAL